MTSMKFSIALLCSAVLTIFSAAACDRPSADEVQGNGAEEEHHEADHAPGEGHGMGHGMVDEMGHGMVDEMGHGMADETGHGMVGETGHRMGHDSDHAMGHRHDPPINVADVETGHWMCEMGTVHYTTEEEGDGSCPICGMRLKQKTADTDEGTDPEAGE